MTTGNSLTLASLRNTGMTAIVVAGWTVTLGLFGAAFFGVENGWTIAAIGLLCSVIPTALWRAAGDSDMVRIVLGSTLPVFPAAILALMKGHGWQIDIHMMFFAGLALLVPLCDWRAILAYTLVTAVHHLGLNSIASQYVFGADAELERVLLHAVILIVEAATLMWVAQRLSALFTVVHEEHSTATRALASSEAAEAESRRLQDAQSQVVTELRKGLAELAQCRLTYRIADRFAAEHEQLRMDFNSAMDSLQGAIGTFSTATDDILNSSGHVVEASQDLARRTEHQANNLQTTAQQTNEISEMVDAAARGAVETDTVFRDVFGQAQSGGGIVREAVAAMDKIETSSKSIGSIVALIEGIAFQTNLLALNAGVEAARAGSAGQGFAVVAHEVRTLAGRAGDAAAQIKALIEASTTQVGEGVRLVGATGATLDNVVGKLENVRALISSAADVSKRQAVGLRSIREVVSDLDQGTQQNAAMAEESNAAMRSMAGSLQTLKAELARFKVA